MGRQLRTLPGSEGEWDVSTGTTGSISATLPNYGVSVIGSSADTYTLDAPSAGVEKILINASSTSAAKVVQLSTDGAAAVKVGNQGATRITFNSTVAEAVHLVGYNSTQWYVLAAHPQSAAVNSTGIVFGTS